MEWISSWSYLPVNYNTCIGTVRNITQRTFIKNNLIGTKLKIKFSNLFSQKALIINQVTIGKRSKTKSEIEEITRVTYQGNEKVVIDPGDEFYSDKIELSVTHMDDLVVSIYIEEATEIMSVCSTWSARSWYTRYGQNGNYTFDQSFQETDVLDVFPVLQSDPNKANHLYGFTDIKVYTDSDVKTIALFGDSITHMSYYSDALIERLYEYYPGKITVVNRGLGGNRLLRDYSHIPEIPGGGTIFGAPGVKRFCNDIYGFDHPEYIIVLIGINDFSHPYALKHYDEAVTIEEYINGMTKLINIAHQYKSIIYIGSLLPFKSGDTDWYLPTEDLRQKANEWILNQSISDGIIDFDQAVRRSDAPEYMLEDCHLGDGLHPNEIGGKKMAEAIPMELFMEEM